MSEARNEIAGTGMAGRTPGDSGIDESRPDLADGAVDRSSSWQLLALSAPDENTLEARTRELRDFLRDSAPRLDHVAAALMEGREDLPFRRFCVAKDSADAVDALGVPEGRRVISGTGGRKPPEIVFMFPGQGSQVVGMGRALYVSEPVFRQTIDECSALAAPHLGRPLTEILYPGGGVDAERARGELTRTRAAQLALFAVELGLARLWMSWGIEPSYLIGHSVGDFTAACVADVLRTEDAVAVLAARGAAMQACPPGSMLAVRAAAAEVEALLDAHPRLQLAAVNGPRLCVVAGATDDIEEFATACGAADIEVRRLHTSHAFHSPMMRSAVAPFSEAIAGVRFGVPRVPIVSSRTGRVMSAEEAASTEFWAGQILDPVRFHEGILELLRDDGRLFLEVGPGTTLSSFARQAGAARRGVVVSSFGHPSDPRDDRALVLEAVGRVWMAGAWPSDSALFDAKAPRIALPTSTYQREQLRVDPPESGGPSATRPEDTREFSPAPVHPIPTESMSAASTPRPSRLRSIKTALGELFEEYSGLDVTDESPETTFLEMGFDSLLLTQIATALRNEFGVRLKFRRMLEDLCTLDRLAEFFDGELPADRFAEPAPAEASAPAVAPSPEVPDPLAVPSPSVAIPAAGAGTDVHALIRQQLTIMQQQIALLAGTAVPGVPATPGSSDPVTGPAAAPSGSREAEVSAPDEEPERETKAFGAQARIATRERDDFTPRQRACFEAFLERYTARTAGSKEFTQRNRKVMSDPRVVTGFRPLWKELVYPIVVDRSAGSRLWDLDGNEYVDLTCGFGSNFLGNQPDFITREIKAQIDRGYEVGPQHPLAAEVAELISELTGMERVAFCNTGSEAVMGAMRAARTITGRKLVAIFADSYHGIFDEVIVRGTKKLRSIAAAPGILASAVENVIVLDYGDPESLRVLRERGDELAAIMAEPVQRRNPSLQPREFLHDLRAIADECGAALIFDEVITGFRISPGGAQEYFDVRADIATYGKIIGGGLPFAAVAGTSRFMDALDGGHWHFGDESYPEVGVTYFAGTFVRHPLALAAARASLEHLKAEGPELQRRLNERTSEFVGELRELFGRTGAPIRVDQFGSLFMLRVDEREPFGSLLYYWLRDHGVHIWEGFGTFLTTAHTDEDLRHLVRAFEASIRELQEGDLLSRAPTESGPEGKGSEEAASPPAVGKEVAGLPLTDAQQEIWSASHMGPEAACAYNECFTLDLEGPLDADLFTEAVARVCRRHDALRLRFDVRGEGQVLSDGAVAEGMAVHDLRGMPAAEADDAMDGVLEWHTAVPFDLAEGPLIRNSLLQFGDERWVFVSSAHHIAFDGWSAGVYVDEIGEVYSSLAAGRAVELPPAPSFVRYVGSALERETSDEGREALAYWLEVFSTIPAPLELPTDRPRPSQRSFAARSLHWEFADETYLKLRRAAAIRNTTLFSLLLSAFGAYLHRLTGQSDVVVGIPMAGQADAGEYGLVGHCVNFLPIRLRPEGDTPFGEFLQSASKDLLDAQDNQSVTLGGILRNLDVPRIPGRAPLVEVVFNLNRKLPGDSFEGLTTRIHEVEKRASNWDMFLNCSEEEGRLTTDFDYNSRLFDEDSIRRFLEGFEELLGAVVDPDESPRIRDLPVMPPESRDELLRLGGGDSADLRGVSVLGMIGERAMETPDKVAVKWADRSLTYGELISFSDRIAASLRVRGVGPGVGVGVCLRRCPELPAVLLGILKAGGFYLPIDHRHPEDRNAAILGDSAIDLVVVDEVTRDAHELGGVATAMLSDLAAGSASERSPQVDDPDMLAYRIYTSGSTGRPKGVSVTRRSLANLLSGMRTRLGLASDDVLLSVTTIAFDISALELLLPLSVGATVVVSPDEADEDPLTLVEAMQSEGVTAVQATPSTWQMLLDAGWAHHLRLALCGGEAFPRELVPPLLERADEVWNLYGPTETTIWSTAHRVRVGEGSLVPIGRPIQNTRTYVMDESGRLLPPGLPGELWIGGIGVAEGYHGREDLTARRFVDDHVAGWGRVYRTGDVVRWRDDGLLEHLGRMDHQVKVRGHRVELGEIEATLAEHPAVVRAVVRLTGAGLDARLVAYVRPAPESRIVATEVRRFLAGRLPEYMVPGMVVEVDEFPLTPNGKIDRASLPDPLIDVAVQEFAEPLGDREKAVARVWRDLLSLDRIGRGDNFFELGGHSLLAIRAVVRLREEEGLEIDVRSFFFMDLEQVAASAESVGRPVSAV